MIFIEPDVDYFRLHLWDVRVPVPVLEQGPDAIAAATASAPTSVRATVVPQCKEPDNGGHDAPLPHKGLKVATATETAGARRSGSAAPSVSSSTDPSKVLAADGEHLHRCESGNDDYRGLLEGEAASCAKITLEERADVVHRALLSALHARFPYEAVDTLEYVYILVVTHHVAPSLASQAFNEDELGSLTSLSGLLPGELRDRTFPSHLNAILDPASAFAAAPTSAKPVSPETATGVAADSAAVQVLHNAPTTPHFFDSIFLLSRALTPEQQAIYYEVQRCGRRLVSCEAVHHARAAAAKVHQSSGTNPQMESFSVIQGRFVHCVPADGSGGGSAETQAASTATSNSGVRRVVGESQSYRVPSSEPDGDRPAQAASPATTLLPAARSLYFSVYRIPLSRFHPAEQQYYADQREELRWRQRHRCRSSYRKLQQKGQPVEQASRAAMPSCGLWCHPQEGSDRVDAARDACSCSSGSESEGDEEDWEGEVGRSREKAVSSLSSAKSRRTRDAADAIDRLLCSEGHGVSDAAEQTSTAEQRSAARFFRTCHEVLTNYAIAHSPYAATGAVEKEETAARTKAAAHGAPSPSLPAATAAVPSSAHQRQQHPRMPWFPRRFAGVSYVGVTRLLYSLAPCDCYHLVMKDHNPFYYARSSRASYESQTVPLCLVSDLSSETGGDGSGALQLAQLKSKPLPRATAAPATAPASAADARCRRFGEQKVQVAPPRVRSPESGVTEQVLLPGCTAPGSRADTLAVADGAGGAAAGSGREGLVCTPFPSRSPSSERADRTSSEARVAAAATRHTTSNPPPSSASPQSRGSLVSATDGFLRVSASLICNNISGNPQARQQSLAEKGVHVPSFLLPDDVRTRGGTDAGPSCRNPHDAALAEGGAAAAAVNLFKALSQSSLAQHKLRHGCIRSVISVAVLDSSQRMSDDSPAVCRSGGASSDGARRYGTLEATQMQLSQHYCCRGLVDHTWLSIPVQCTPAEQDAIQWMPVMLGSTDCVSDVGLRTAVHLGIFPRALPPSRSASGGPPSLTAACSSTPSDQLDGVLPTRDDALSSLQLFKFRRENPTAALRQTVSSGAAAAADNALAGARLSNSKKGMSTAMPPVAPLRARPVNRADDGVAADIDVGAAPRKIQESGPSAQGGAENGREAASTPATTITQARSSTFSAVGRLEQARTPLTSFSALHTKGGVPLAFDSTGDRQSHAVPWRGTTPWGRLSFTATTTAEKGEMGSEHAHVAIDDEEEQLRAPTPPATATSVRVERGGIALTFDAGPTQQRKPPSSSATGGAPTTWRRSTHPATLSARCSAEFPRDCSRYVDGAMKGKDHNEESVEVALDFSDGDGDDPERRMSPSCAHTPARTPRALAWTPLRGNQVAQELAAAEDADNERRRGGGGSKVSEQVSGAITAAPKSYSFGARGSSQAATKVTNWPDKSLRNATATRTGSRSGGSLHFPSVLHTAVEGTVMEDKEQLDVNRSVRGRGAALMPATYGAAAERRAGVFGTSGSKNISRSSGPLPASLPAPRSNPFLMQTHKTPAANSNQPYYIDTGTPPHPSPLPRCFAGYTPFQPASGLPQHVPRHQQQTPIPTSRPTSVSATPTQRFSVPFTPFGQGAELRYQTTAPTLEQQLPPHTHQHGARATGFAAVAAPYSRVPPSTVDLSASAVSLSSNSSSGSMCLPLRQHPSASPPPQECFFDDPVASRTTCETREPRGGTASTATPTTTSDGGTAPRGAQSAASPSAYFAMAWNARKTAPQQHRLSGGIAEHPSSSAWLSPLPQHATHEQARAPQSRPRISFYPPLTAARSAPSLSAQLLNPSAYYTPPARQTIGAGRLSLFSSPLAPQRGSGGGGGGPAALAVDACGLSRSLFIDEYDDGAVTAGSASHLRGDARAASRVRPRGVSAMDAAWWQPVRELTSAPNLHHGAAAPAAGHSRSSMSTLRLPGADQPYNLPLGSTSNPHSHSGSLCGDCGGCRKGCATAAGDPALQQRRRNSCYHREASSLGRGTATAPVRPSRAAVPPLPTSRLGGLRIDARNAEKQNVDDAYVEELSLSPVTPHRTQMRTPFAVRRARRAAATTGHSFGLSSRRRPPLAPRSAGGDAARGSSCNCAEANERNKSRAHYGAATSSSTAAWRDGLSVRERVQLRRWQLDKEERLASYRTHLQANYLCGSMPKRYCFERQTGGAAADTRPAPLSGDVARESGVTGSSEQPQSAAGGYAVWTPRTTAVPPMGHETAAVLQVGKSARDFSLGVHSFAPVSTATSASTASGAGGPDVDAARVYQAEAHLRQQANTQSQIEARQQMKALADGAAAARLVTGVNVSFTLRDVATVFLRLPRTSLHASRTPGTAPWHVSGGAGLDVLDVCDAVWRTEGVSCFLSRKPTQLRGGWASYLERINLYQAPFFLRDQAFVLLLPVPHTPTLKVCVAIHSISDLLALVCQTPVARILPTAAETWMRQREYGFEDANDNAEERQDGAAMVVAERRWLFGLFTTRRLVPAAGARASRKADRQLLSPKDDNVKRREKCRRLRREYQADGLCLTWRHRARLWYALLRAGLSCLALPACTSPLLIDPVACNARCALLCDRIAAYAVAHHRLETLKAIRQSYLETRAAELSKERVGRLCERTHHGTARGIQLGGTGGSSSRVAASRSQCTPSPLLPSAPTRQQRRVSGVGDDGVDSTVHQGRYPVTWGRTCDSTLRTGLHGRFSSTDEASRDPRMAHGGVVSTLETPSTTWGRPLFAASTSEAPLHSGHFEASRQRFDDRGDKRQQRAGTPIPPRLSAIGGISRTHPSLRQRDSSRDRWATPPPPRTTRSMQLRLAANQRVAAGDAPVSSLRHATHASVLGEGRLTFSDGEQCSDAFGLHSRRSFTPPPRPPPSRPPPPQQQQLQPRWDGGFGAGATSTWTANGRDGAVGVPWQQAHTCGDTVATSCRRESTLARPVAGAPGVAFVNVLYDAEAGSHPYASDGARGTMHAARSATVVAADKSHASSAASHGLFAPAASTVAPYASGTSIVPSSDAQATAAAENGAQRVILSSTAASSLARSAAAASTDLDLILRVDRDDASASVLAGLTEHRAVTIAPPLVTVLSIVPLAAQPVRGAGAGVVEDGDSPTVKPADTGAASPLYPGFIPTPLEVQQRLAQPFNLSIAQVQQLLRWQWEHHQHCYTLMPVPLFTGAAAGPTEVDFSLRFWSSPQSADSVSRGGLDERASAASPSYAVSPLARELLLHLLRWSWLLPTDYEASRRSRRHRLAATTTSSLASLFRCLISPSPLRCPRWRTLALIVLLVTAAEHSAWCLQALLFGGVGYCAMNGVTVGLLTQLPSHRGASRRRDCDGCLPWHWWWGRWSTGAADVCSRGGRCSASRLVRRPLSALQDDVPPIDDRVSLLYSVGESTTHDMLERRRVHFAAQVVLVRVLRLQSAAASLLSRLQLFLYGYSTALSLWVALLLLAYALLYVVYREAVLAVHQSRGGAAWSAACNGFASAETVSAFWQVARRILHAMWWNTNAASTTACHPSQSAASALTGAACREVLARARYILLQRQRTVVDGVGEAATAGVASGVEAQLLSGSDPAVKATERTGGSAGAGAAHGHYRSPSHFYQNGKYFAYDAQLPAWAKSEAAAAATPSSIGATPGAHYERVSAQPQRQEPSPSASVVQSLSAWFSHIVQDGGRDGNDGSGKHQPSALCNHSADPMGSNSTYVTANSSAAYKCPNKAAGSSVGDPSVLWFLVVAYVVTVCLPWSPYRWLWRRVWSVLMHDDALARRPLLTV
ncbi:conserved hypothetical protein [Leishmania major strain Friedlin]|uniref:Uncharacterized protein n=1 Tax=Leishmania major TaxID=5664 RepID=Q4QDA7_LEIMA|nr:conserved hypothetical protein [Leishmania major strain Friedlin]CAG9572813.1 hypothetical_protein_-_conserved [Leishmania major strain Friedlin]CAJ07199.1 conserved hypothetical protein [Leishmania major strain Friedlin]|eukprot:XP_001682691.1 conserved hypothetical protein [Leishmania major strain Friedlin]